MSFFEQPALQYATGPHPHYAFIWLHGLGADGHDFAGFVEAFADATGKAMRFVFPHAPIQAVTLNGGACMPAWFDLYGTRPEDPQDEAGIQRASQAVSDLIREQAGHGIPAERVILGGFSQGGGRWPCIPPSPARSTWPRASDCRPICRLRTALPKDCHASTMAHLCFLGTVGTISWFLMPLP